MNGINSISKNSSYFSKKNSRERKNLFLQHLVKNKHGAASIQNYAATYSCFNRAPGHIFYL